MTINIETLMAHWDEAEKSGQEDTPLEQAIAKHKRNMPYNLSQNGVWHLEGFVAFFGDLRDIVAAIDPSTPPCLPPQCLDPVQIARFFRIPIENFNFPGVEDGAAFKEAFRPVRDQLDELKKLRTVEPMEDGPVQPGSLRFRGELHEGFTSREFYLLNCLWNKKKVTVDEAIERVYGLNRDDKDAAIIAAKKSVCAKLAAKNLPITISQTQAHFILEIHA